MISRKAFGKKQVLIFALASSTLVGCSNKASITRINESSDANKAAKSHIEWETSDVHPTRIFANIQMNMMLENLEQAREDLKSSTCNDLSHLDDANLTLFENEIRSKINESIIAACKESLIVRLDKYAEAQRKSLPVSVDAMNWSASGNNFKFPDNVQKRDVSKGYKAWAGDVKKKEVVLTFDDGPSGVYTPIILKALAEVNAKAVFFSMGKNIRQNPDTLRQVAAAGHSIGTHSNTHACLGTSLACAKSNGRNLTQDEAIAEVKAGHQAAYDTLGWVDPFFRFPYGETSVALSNMLKETGTGEFGWNIDTEDWRAQSNEQFLKKVITEVEKFGRGIVLFHDIQRKTAETLPAILRELHTRGYSIVLLQPEDLTSRLNSPLVKKRPMP